MGSAIYNLETGEIIAVRKSPYDPEMTAPEGYAVIECDGGLDIDNRRVSKDGRIIRKPKKVIAAQESDEARRRLKAHRNHLLTESDWTQMPDAPVDREAWAAYRQALRDLPANTPDPHNPEWPEAPE